MSDDRRNFLVETIGGFLFLSIAASLIFGGKKESSEGNITPEKIDTFEKLTESASAVASFFGCERFAIIMRIGSFLVDILRPTPLPASDVLPMRNDSMSDIHTEMQTVIDLYFEKRYAEAISYIDQSTVISNFMQQNEDFNQSIQMIKSILQELMWIDTVQTESTIDNFDDTEPLFNLHKIYLSVWYGKTERSIGLEQFRTAYESLKNIELQDTKDITFKEIGIVFATLVFSYDFQNDQSLSSYDNVVENAKSRFEQIDLPQDFKNYPIIDDQWKNLRLRFDVFDKNTNNRTALFDELSNSTLEPDEKNYLIGANALYDNKPAQTINVAEQIGSPLHRNILLAFGSYLKAKNDSDTSDMTQEKIRMHFESIRNSDQNFFCQLYHNNTPIFDYVYESREWFSFIKNIFSDSEIEEIKNSCKGLQ